MEYNRCCKSVKIMAKKIILEFTEPQLEALMQFIDSGRSVFEESVEEQKNLKLIDRMFFKNGFKRRQ